MEEDWRKEKRTVCFAFMLSFLLTFTEILGTGLRLSANIGGIDFSLLTILWMTVSSAILSPITEPFFFKLICTGEELPRIVSPHGSLLKIFLMTWLTLFLCYIPCFLAFYPGLYCYDMIWQWQMFTSGIFNTHHPLVHTLFAGGILELGKYLFGSYNAGLALHSLIQLAILSGSIAFAIRYMVKIRLSPKLRTIALAFYILFPFLPVTGLSTTKDVIFGCLFLMFFVCICDMVTTKNLYQNWRFLLFLGLSILMGLFRNNAAYGLAIASICCLGLWMVKTRSGERDKIFLKFSVIFFACVIGTFSGFFVLEKTLHASKGSVAEMLSIPCQQLARTYVFHNTALNLDDKEDMEKFISSEAMNSYKYYVSDPVKSGLDVDYLKNHKKEFVRMWIRLGRQYPSEFVLAPLYNTMGIWYMGGDSSCYVEYSMSPAFDEKHVVEAHSIIPALKKGYSWFTDEHIQKSLPMISLLFYTSFYSWMILTCTIVIAARRQYRYLILSIVLLSYIFSLIPGPCLTIRYMFGIILCVPVMMALTFYLPDNRKN